MVGQGKFVCVGPQETNTKSVKKIIVLFFVSSVRMQYKAKRERREILKAANLPVKILMPNTFRKPAVTIKESGV